jgi:hypothetical protein
MSENETHDLDFRTATSEDTNRLMTLGVNEALREHREQGRTIVVWRDGRVVHVSPEEIPASDSEGQDRSPPDHERPTFEGLRARLQHQLDRHAGNLPEKTTSAWDGYFAALVEWGLISAADHKRLSDMLPVLDNNPAESILVGR